MAMTSEEKHRVNQEFLKAFPLEKLKNMTLEQYSNLNRSDSFCYWIESKTTDLGSVWGGSAYKFGIFQYDKKPQGDMSNRLCDSKYAWYSSLGNTAEEAFTKVREAIVKIATYGHDKDLQAIDSVNVLGPIIKWKIAFLYSDEYIVPYYSLDRLRVIAEGKGMKDANNSSIADIQNFLITNRQGQEIHSYGEELHAIWLEYEAKQKAQSKVWMWLGNSNTFKEERLLAGNSVSSQMRDYSRYSDYKSMRNDYQKVKGNTDVSVPDAYWKFIKDVKVNDIVVVFDNKRIGKQNHHEMLGWGIFTSELINDIDSDNPLQRCVEWKKILDEPITSGIVRNSMFFHKTTNAQTIEIKKLLGIDNFESTESGENQMATYQSYINLLKENHNLVLTGAPGTGKTFMAKEIAKEMGCTKNEMCFVQFHPSYDYTDFVEGLRPMEKNDGSMGFERKDGIFKDFCKKAIKNLIDSAKSIESLTKELSWEEKLQRFVEDATEKNTVYTLSNGNEFTIEEIHERTIVVHNEQNEKTTRVSVNADEIIELLTNEVPLNIVRDIRNYFNRKFGTQPDSYAFIITKAIREMKKKIVVANADKIERKDFVFIIDEINRGEVSKIFGELFYAIDPGYRGKTDIKVKTQYQNLVPETDVFAEGFYVPENVYILATMNDIDRSVESMDFAMRRRFTWTEVVPSDTESMLDILPCAEKAKAAMHSLNAAIEETDGLGYAYMIGPSYFLKLGKNGGDFHKLWEMNIEPLLKEYLRGFRKSTEILVKFCRAYYMPESTDDANTEELTDEN